MFVFNKPSKVYVLCPCYQICMTSNFVYIGVDHQVDDDSLAPSMVWNKRRFSLFSFEFHLHFHSPKMSAFVTHHWILSAPVHVFPFVSWLDICSISSLITFMTMSLSFYFPSWYLFASKTRKTTIRSVGSFVSSNDCTFIPEFCISFFLDCLFVWMLRLDGCCLVSSRDCVCNFRNKACVFWGLKHEF